MSRSMESVEFKLDLGALSRRMRKTPQQVSDILRELEKQHIVKIIERDYKLIIVVPRTVEIGLFLEDEAVIASEFSQFDGYA